MTISDSKRSRPQLTNLIRVLHQGLRVAIEARLRAHGLTLQQFAVLANLRRKPGASSAELARAAFVSPQTMGDVLAALERAGLIERAASPENARILRTRMTREGMRALKDAGQDVAAVEARVFSVLSPDEQRILISSLERCAEALGCEEGDTEASDLTESRRAR